MDKLYNYLMQKSMLRGKGSVATKHVTKMTRRLGKQAISIHCTRMQIEKEFRNMKSSAFGLGFEQSQSRLLRRLTILILLTTLASPMLLLLGLSVLLISKF
jgi:hypothetical protein